MKSQDISLHADEAATLIAAAAAAASNAYAPYSGFRVGAALLLADGTIVTGVNIENASYGLTICAERSAISNAVSQHGPSIHLHAIAVTNLNSAPSSPCGACRQVLAEFAAPGAWIAFPFEGEIVVQPFANLFPFPFGMANTPVPESSGK